MSIINKHNKTKGAGKGVQTYKDENIRYGRYKDAREYKEARLSGLDYMSNKSKDCTVLDLGCAEGLVSEFFASSGASLIHAVEQIELRAATAKELTNRFQKEFSTSYHVICDDFYDSKNFLKRNKNCLLKAYNIVLLLGIFHNVKSLNEINIRLGPIVDIASNYLLCRGPLFADPTLNFEDWAKERGFVLIKRVRPNYGATGDLFVFKKEKRKNE